MAADTQKKNEELTINERLGDFLQKNRKILLSVLACLAVILIGFTVVFSIRDRVRAKALSQVDAFNRRYDALKSFINSEEPVDDSKQEEISALQEELAVFASKKSGYAAARAYGISADIYADQKKWAEAEKAWSASAKAAGKSYLGPVSVFNAAVAAEEQGNIESAIELYTKAIDFGNVFPAAARAQFSVGRLQESLNNREAAIEAYRNIVSKWPGDPVWSNLAQSRIVVLSD
jgi:tetratricopeptide (TPR) repeat protein